MEKYMKAAMEVIDLGKDVIATSGCAGVQTVVGGLGDGTSCLSIGGSCDPWTEG